MLKFIALKIGNGDSFLLQHNDRTMLVDTGLIKGNCLLELTTKRIKKIDAVIITHYDRDHIGGLSDLLDSKIIVRELWLPDIIGRIHSTVESKSSKLLSDLSEDLVDASDDLRTLEIGIFDRDLVTILKMNSRGEISVKPTTISLNVALIERIILKCRKSGTKIRWIKYVKSKIDRQLPLNFIGINCEETELVTPFADDIEVLYYLTRINHESLVLKYSNETSPEVLFTADTGFEFLTSSQTINLREHSIVTAPHHGSSQPENEKGYSAILGSRIVYVRSHNSTTSPPNKYTKQLERYCTRCHGMADEQEVEIVANGTRSVRAVSCSCI